MTVHNYYRSEHTSIKLDGIIRIDRTQVTYFISAPATAAIVDHPSRPSFTHFVLSNVLQSNIPVPEV